MKAHPLHPAKKKIPQVIAGRVFQIMKENHNKYCHAEHIAEVGD